MPLDAEALFTHVETYDLLELLAVFQHAPRETQPADLDAWLLRECLHIELAGPQRGHLVTGVDAYNCQLLATALLWLHLRDQAPGAPLDNLAWEALFPFILHAVGLERMVSTNVIDRVQAYVVATILLRPPGPEREVGEASDILANMWARAADVQAAHADTVFPFQDFDVAAADTLGGGHWVPRKAGNAAYLTQTQHTAQRRPRQSHRRAMRLRGAGQKVPPPGLK